MLVSSLKVVASFSINFLPEHKEVHKEDDEDRAEPCPVCSCSAFTDVDATCICSCGASPQVHWGLGTWKVSIQSVTYLYSLGMWKHSLPKRKETNKQTNKNVKHNMQYVL